MAETTVRRAPVAQHAVDHEAAIYIHVPFCASKCGYCDFNSYAGLQGLADDYVDALCLDMASTGKDLDERGERPSARSLYLGGGTPTLLSSGALDRVLRTALEAFPPRGEPEVTVEVRPGTAGVREMRTLRRLGVNRLSLGIQSFHDDALRRLGRAHDSVEGIEAYRDARAAGFDNVSLDLLYGIPGQEVSSWVETLGRAVELGPEHLSLYPLSLSDETPMGRRAKRGELALPAQDDVAEMFEMAETALAEAGYDHYELSNWARRVEGRDLRCRHNLAYWRLEPYLGFGAGAHSFHNGARRSALERPWEYIRAIEAGRPVQAEAHTLDLLEMASDFLILGLRLGEGVDAEAFQRRFAVSVYTAYVDEIEELERAGLIEVDGDAMRLTPRGRLLGNEVFERFL